VIPTLEVCAAETPAFFDDVGAWLRTDAALQAIDCAEETQLESAVPGSGRGSASKKPAPALAGTNDAPARGRMTRRSRF
jgi:hypothetical protein